MILLPSLQDWEKEMSVIEPTQPAVILLEQPNGPRHPLNSLMDLSYFYRLISQVLITSQFVHLLTSLLYLDV